MHEQQNSPDSHQKKLPILPRLAILFATMSITGYIVLSITLGKHAGVFPTKLTLKKESCDFLQQEKVAVRKLPDTDSICTLTTGFRSNVFEKGGVMYLGDRGFNLADNQLVATELVDEPAAIQSRIVDLALIFVCSGFLMGTMLALFRI
jgi:hypothetical protein